MKGATTLIAMILAVTLLFAGCGSETGETPPSGETAQSGEVAVAVPAASLATDPETNQEIVDFITQPSSNPDKVLVRYTVTQNGFIGNSPAFLGDREFFRSLKEQLGDKVEIQLYFSAPFGGSGDAFVGGLQNQTFEVINWAAASFSEYTTAFNPLETPYLFDDTYDALTCLNETDMGEVMSNACIEDTGIRILAYSTNGARVLSNDVREVRVPSDLEGIKVRVQPNPIHIAMVEAWGGSAASIAYSELYTGLQQGVVDGQENPLTNYSQMNFAEVQDYLTLTDHLIHVGALAVNETWYQGLSQEVKDAIDVSSDAFVEYSELAMRDQEPGLMALVEDMQVYTPTAEEKETWVEVSTSVWPMVAESCPEGYWEEVITAAGKTVS